MREPARASIRAVADPSRRFTARAQPLIEEAAERSRLSARMRAERLRGAARLILQATIAAVVAWVLATEVIGHPQPFFAPVSAMITLGLTQGERGRRALDVVLGVTLGIAVADLLVIQLGTGWWQLGVVVALSMSVALLLGSGQMFAQQAAVSAALVATLQPPDDGVSFARAVDALLGGGVALAVSALVLPAHPARMVREAAAPVLAELAAVLDDVARALEARDLAAVQSALDRGRAIDDLYRTLDEALGGRAARPPISPRRGGACSARSTSTPTRPRRWTWRSATSASSRAAPGGRSTSTRTSRPRRRPRCGRSPTRSAPCAARSKMPGARTRCERPALRAAGQATLVLERTGNLSVSVIVGQVRSTAVDLLRGTGMSYEEATEAVRGAVREVEGEAAEGGGA